MMYRNHWQIIDLTDTLGSTDILDIIDTIDTLGFEDLCIDMCMNAPLMAGERPAASAADQGPQSNQCHHAAGFPATAPSAMAGGSN